VIALGLMDPAFVARLTPSGGGPVLWTPAQITTAVWLDAADAGTIVLNGSNVSQWRDKSGNGRHVSQSTASQQPIYDAINGIITFDGSNDFLSNATVGASGLTSVSFLTVMRMNAGGNNEDIPMGPGVTASTGAVRCLYRTPNGTTVGFATWARDLASSAFSYDIGGKYRIIGAWNTQLATPNNVRITRDGATPIAYTTGGGGLNTTADGFSVGSLRGGAVGNYYSNISVREIIVLYEAVSDLNRQLIEGYLAWKWGLQADLPGGHPYKSAAPTV
jgi:hypothetical protein